MVQTNRSVWLKPPFVDRILKFLHEMIDLDNRSQDYLFGSINDHYDRFMTDFVKSYFSSITIYTIVFSLSSFRNQNIYHKIGQFDIFGIGH